MSIYCLRDKEVKKSHSFLALGLQKKPCFTRLLDNLATYRSVIAKEGMCAIYRYCHILRFSGWFTPFSKFFYKGPSILRSMLIHNHSVGSDVIIMSQLNLGLQFYQKKKNSKSTHYYSDSDFWRSFIITTTAKFNL